jgi:cytochrome c551
VIIMKKFVMGIVVMGLVGVLSACGGNKSAEPAPAPAQQTQPSGTSSSNDTAAAEATFKNTCASCHGADLAGNVGPNLQHIGSKYTKDQIVGIITNGKGGVMPPGLLKSPEKEQVAAWLAAKK